MTDTRPLQGPIVAIIPVRGRDLERTGGMPELGGRPLLAYTVEAARAASRVDRIVVSTDSEDVRRLAIALGAEAPFVRPPELAVSGVPIERVLLHCLTWLDEHDQYRPTIVVRLEISHPFRQEGLIDRAIDAMVTQGLDTMFTAFEEHHNFWKMNAWGDLEPILDVDHTRARQTPIYKEMSGLVCVTTTDVIRSGHRIGTKVGLVPLTSLQALVDTQDAIGLELARRLI